MVAENTVSKESLQLTRLSYHFGVVFRGHLDNMFVLIRVEVIRGQNVDQDCFYARIRHMTIVIWLLSFVITRTI